jgi:polyphosphate kinase 2
MGEKLPKKAYEKELYRLQAELVKMQNWTRASGARIVVVFEGRDAAGKGGTINRVGQYLNPRFARTVALDRPSDRETGQWYFQRYIAHLPTAGEIVLFDRSWYNRAGVERVMGFSTKEQYSRFMRQCPVFERMLVEDGILLRKYWFSVSDTEQQARFESRLDDPVRRWKLSPMDLESVTRWEDYSRAKDDMFTMTDIPEAPWYVVESDDKRRARVNMIAHLLSTIPYHDVPEPKLKLPRRPASTGYVRTPIDMQTFVPDHAASLLSPGTSPTSLFALILAGWPQSCELTVMRQTGAREQRGTAATGRRAGRFCQLLGLAGARGRRVRRNARRDRRRA